MSKSQRSIKFIAIILAIMIIVIMVYIFIKALMFFQNPNENQSYNNKYIGKNVSVIDIDLRSASLSIERCSKLRVDTDNEFVKIDVIDNKLKIREKKHSIFTRKNTDSVTICLPKKLELEDFNIDMGAGKLEIEELTSKRADFDLGAGSFTIDKINISEEFDLDGGAGNITIEEASLNDSDIDLGIGVLNLNGELLGHSKIDGGVGSINITLVGNKEDYKFNLEKGVGRITIDDESYISEEVGKGNNIIKLTTGVGNAKIKFKNNEL